MVISSGNITIVYHHILIYIKCKHCTAKMCRIAVQQDGEVLECVPVSLRTAEMCQAEFEKLESGYRI